MDTSQKVDSAEAVPAPSGVAPGGQEGTAALYRAALGPVNTARYLAVFERFDAVGRRTLVWHGPAALFTLGWLLFRRLWGHAVLYTLIVGALAGLAWWHWPVLRAWPPGVQAGLLGSLLLLHLVVPGLMGYALVHRQVQERLLQAVRAAKSVDEACVSLSRQAASGRRLQGMVAVSVVLLAVGLLLLSLGGSRDSTGDLSGLHRLAPEAAPTVPATTNREVALSVVRQPVAQSVDVQAADDRPPVITPTEQEPPAPPVALAHPPEPAHGVALTRSSDEAGPYAINVGLFAVADNAQRAVDLLLREGLPATQVAIESARGPRWRVRVGPFAESGQADAAALRIRALGLEAVVFRR